MIDKTKTYRTRDGREVRIYATDGAEMQEVHGAVLYDDGWGCRCWDGNGKSYTSHDLNLFEVKPRIKTTLWLNVYKGTNGKLYGGTETTRELANKVAGPDRLDCIPVPVDVEDKS